MDGISASAELFLNYDYVETRDLLKAFLTLVSGTWVFSVAFSEKIAKTHEADNSVRNLMFTGWACFFSALILAGLSVVVIAAAAGCVLYGGLLSGHDCNGYVTALWSWALGLLAGMLYAFGLLCLALAARRAIWLGMGKE